jgi:hypothetical protein
MRRTRDEYKLLVFLIIAISFFWRFVNYSERWVLNQDQARDVIISIYALRNLKFPLLGPPSSAGPFSFGPLYYWLVIVGTFSFPFQSGPWVFFTILSSLSAYLYILIGKRVGGKTMGLFLGLVSALAAAQVINSTDMLNTVLVSFAGALVFLFLAYFCHSGKKIFLFLLAFATGFAINSHFQSLGLLTLFPLVVLISRDRIGEKVKMSFAVLAGLITAFLPLIYFDFKNDGVWIKSVYYYYTEGQKKFYIPVRWLTDLRDFWPQLYGKVIINLPTAGYFLLLLGLISLFLAAKNKHRFTKFWWIVSISMAIQIFLVRYYGGTRSPEYFFAFHPYFIFFAGWTLSIIYKYQKKFGMVLLIIFLGLSFYSNFRLTQLRSQAPLVLSIKKSLDSYNSGKRNFRFYTRNGDNMINLPIFYLLYREKRVSPFGLRVGTCRLLLGEKVGICPDSNKIITSDGGYTIYDLSSYSDEDLFQRGYEEYTPKKIYNWLYINYGKKN